MTPAPNFRRQRAAQAKPRRMPDERRAGSWRMVALYLMVIGVFAVLSVRLLSMQVLGASRYRLQADGNRIRVETTLPARGGIVDRNGQSLVTNVPVFSATLTPADLPKEQEQAVFDALNSLLGVPVWDLERKVARVRGSADPYQPILVRGEVDAETALVIAERRRELPGVEIRYDMARAYPDGDVLGLILGYAGRLSEEDWEEYQARGYRSDERVGKAGVELSYESYLRGTPGRRQVEVDGGGNELRTIAESPAKPGATLQLSIDRELQRAVTQIMRDEVSVLNSRKAVAMVMDVRTGELLASVSLPGYNNNVFSRDVDEEELLALLNDPNKPLLDHAIAEKFAPGSTFKQVTGLAALQEGVATTRTSITSKGALLLKRDYDPTISDSFPDWHPNLGTLDFYHGVAMSSDIYFYCLAGGNCPEMDEGLGSARLSRYARMLGFGELTGVDLPGETAGMVGDPAWLEETFGQQWYTADTFFLGIGQGYIEATPLQVLRMTAAVANGGNLLRPKVVREVRDVDGEVLKPAGPEVVRRLEIEPEHLKAMRDAMRLAVTEGTANKAAIPGVSVAGKTGTAEFGSRLGAGSIYGRYKEHGWMVAFAPYEAPEIAVVVFNEEGSGANTAAPATARILDYYFNQRPRLAQNR